MPITGIGNYYVKDGTRAYPICFSSFSLIPDTANAEVPYKDWNSSIKYTRNSNINKIRWTLDLKENDINFEALELLYGTFGIREEDILSPPGGTPLDDYNASIFPGILPNYSTKVTLTYTGGPQPTQPFWNLAANCLNEDLNVGERYSIIQEQTGSAREVLNPLYLNFQYCFKGIIFENGEPSFYVEIDEMYRKSGSSLSPTEEVTHSFEVIEPKIWDFDTPNSLQGTIQFANVPTEYVSGSQIILAGQLTVTSNPDNIPIDSIALTSVFDFATPGTETINFTTESDGTFSVEYEVDPALSFPQNGFLRVTFDDGGELAFEQAITVQAPVIPGFSAAISGGESEFSNISIGGDAPPGATVTLSSTNLGDLWNGSVVIANLSGEWSLSDVVPNSVVFGTNYTVTASTSGFSDIIIPGGITSNKIFDPQLIYGGNFYVTGLEVILNNNETVRSNQDITVLAVTNTTTIVNTTVTSDDGGTFSLPFTIPISEEGKTITWTFTEVISGNIVILMDTAPAFNPNITLQLDNGQGILISGQDSLTGQVEVSEGYTVQIQLKDGLGNEAGVISLQNVNGLTAFIVPINPGISPGNFSIEATSDNHITEIIDPIPPTVTPEIKESIDVDVSSGLIYPGRQITFSGTGPGNQPLTLNVFGSNFNTTVGNDQTWSIDVTVNGSQALGPYIATATSDGTIATVNLNVDTSTLTLNGCTIGATYFTNASGNFASFSGELLPNKTLTIDWTGIPLSQTLVTPDEDGFWELEVNVPWTPRGTWSANFSAPGEATLMCSGDHEPDLRFTPEQIALLQGDTGNSVQIRGKANFNYSYIIDGPLPSSGTVFTNSLGFATIPISDVPTFIEVVDSGLITVDGSSVSYTLRPKVEISIEISNPSTFDSGGRSVLFTEGIYTVRGSIPENGVYSLSAIGSSQGFTLESVSNETYTATLETNDQPGSTEITVATIFQDPEMETFVVSPPISFDIPDSFIVDSLYDFIITTDPDELVEIEITGDTDGQIDLITTSVGPTGILTYVFDTTGLTEGQEITIRIRNEYFRFPDQTRQLGGFGSGVPEPLPVSVFQYSVAPRFPEHEVTNVSFSIDNSLVNEAGFPDDLVSNFIIAWGNPSDIENLSEYQVEEYTTTWAVVLNTPNNSYMPSSSENIGVRITAIYEGFYTSSPVYSPDFGGVFLAKSFYTTSVFSYSKTDPITTPEEPSFFSIITTQNEEDSLFTSTYPYAIIEDVTTPEEALFFSQLTIRNTDEDSLSSSVYSFSKTEDITTPEEAPFFTI